MIRFIYRLFKKRFDSLAFEDRIHGDWRDKCDNYYTDSNGVVYWRYKDLMDMPNSRREYFENLLNLWELSFSTKEYAEFIKEFKNTISDAVNNIDKRGESLARLMHFADELDKRRDIRINQDLLLETMAVILIRDDENPNQVDHKSIDIKTKQFLDDDKLRDSAFFLQAGLERHIPYLKTTQQELKKYIQTGILEIKRSREVLGTLTKK